ncbi:flagellar biosynthesis protein FlhF [Horticoccus sp. 23ND18S-11]|uniref:flagellar biosynthesis protein FlhF n=1 Tax=Horticoccus sp. 23ND18S-11 TaxID=3391832 RepID=UPI0039C94570
MSHAGEHFAPGTYKFTVKSTEEAVTIIRDRLGPTARVISVRAVESTGLKRLFGSPRLEVVAQVDAVEAANASGDAAGSFDAVSAELATPDNGSETAPEVAPRSRLTPFSSSLGLTGLLRRSGITETALNRIQAGRNWNELNTLPLHRALAETSRLLRSQVEARTARPPLARAAFLGAAGVGRTTALCKWLSQEVFRRARIGHVVTVEFDRPNPLGPLPVFSEALGVPLAHFPCETQAAVPGGFVYLDLPALSVRRPADNAPIAAFLDREQIRERVLVLNAAYDRASLRDAYAAGCDLGATHLVFTHLDEVPQWGKLWDYLFDESIEPLFLATGPSLTGDCEEDVPGAIVRRTLPDDDTSA